MNDHTIGAQRMMRAAAEEIARIHRTGVLPVAPTARKYDEKTKHEHRAIERGVYVPDDAHMEICLNCTRKTCTGNCKLMAGRMKKKVEG
jgi:hypothetical protein